jgi:hypothetical protein
MYMKKELTANTVLFLCLLNISALLPIPCKATEHNTNDLWRSGYRSDSWRVIEDIQRYPMFTDESPDWEMLVDHNDPYVRVATIFAIARANDPNLIPLLTPLLLKGTQLDRNCGVFSLWSLQNSDIRTPILEIIGNWEDLRSANRLLRPLTMYDLFARLKLPTLLLDLSLSERKAWLETFDVSAWNPVLRRVDLGRESSYDHRSEVYMSLEKSHWDDGNTVKYKIGVCRPKGKMILDILVEARGEWSEISSTGKIRRAHPRQISINRIIKELKPKELRKIEGLITHKKSLSPGVYMLRLLGSMRYGYFIVRVQRSEEIENKIPELLEGIGQNKNIEILGEQRIQAAIPGLIKAFRENGLNKNNFVNGKIAMAFARIQDARAIPVMLEYPSIRGGDLISDTSGALGEFGAAAYPYYEKRILGWKKYIDRYVSSVDSKFKLLEPVFGATRNHERKLLSLMISLRLLGSNGSEKIQKARLELMLQLSQQIDDNTYQKYSLIVAVLANAVVANASVHTDQTIEAIWATRNSPRVCIKLLAELRREEKRVVKPIYAKLWQRLQKESQRNQKVESYLREALTRIAPKLLNE